MKKIVKTKLELECQLLSAAMNFYMGHFWINKSLYFRMDETVWFFSAYEELEEFENNHYNLVKNFYEKPIK